jgi:hypothetical protein
LGCFRMQRHCAGDASDLIGKTVRQASRHRGVGGGTSATLALCDPLPRVSQAGAHAIDAPPPDSAFNETASRRVGGEQRLRHVEVLANAPLFYRSHFGGLSFFEKSNTKGVVWRAAPGLMVHHLT